MRQRLFCLEYLVDLSATRAAIRAGYSRRSAASIGEENLRKPEIQAFIEKAMKEREKRTLIRADHAIQELAVIAFARITDFVDIKNGKIEWRNFVDSPVAGCILEILEKESPGRKKKRIRLHDKVRALELLGLHFGLFPKHKHRNTKKASEDTISRFQRTILKLQDECNKKRS